MKRSARRCQRSRVVVGEMPVTEDMQTYFLPGADFPMGKLMALLEQLRAANLLTPGFIPPPVGLYDVRGWINEVLVNDIEFQVILDRNLVSLMAQLGRGEPMNDERRPAAVLMALAHHFDFVFDPSIAYHELASSQGNDGAYEELSWFRAADNAPRLEWLELALGKRSQLSHLTAATNLARGDLEMPLRRWRRNYIAALTIAELELHPGPAIGKVEAILDWMSKDFFMAGPAALCASLYFAPSAPKAGLLKSLRSSDRSQAIAGIKNVAWDITYLSEFTRSVQDRGTETRRFLLATSDKALSRIASALFHNEDTDNTLQMAARLREWWQRPGDAERIAAKFFQLIDDPQSQERQLHREVPNDFISALIADKEARVLAWEPKESPRAPV